MVPYYIINVKITQFTFDSQYVTLQIPVQITSLFIQSIVAIKKSSISDIVTLIHIWIHLQKMKSLNF